VSVHATDVHSPVGTAVRVRVDGGAWSELGQSSGNYTLRGLADGQHLIEVSARDGAGNDQVQEPQGFAVTVDTVCAL
jgi:hypothetical protein